MTIRCEIESIDYLNHDTRRVILRTPHHIEFHAGQYLEIVLHDRHCPFSIASKPKNDNLIELHIRPTDNSDDSDLIENLLDTQRAVDIQIPLGECFIETLPTGPLLLIAASTGVTQMKSIIEHLHEAGFTHEIFLYWGVLKEEDIYLKSLCDTWSKSNSNFFFAPVISEPALSPSWAGRTGLVGKVALDDLFGSDVKGEIKDEIKGEIRSQIDPKYASSVKYDNAEINNFNVYISGGPAMVYATMDLFVEKGLSTENAYSDMFSLAPR